MIANNAQFLSPLDKHIIKSALFQTLLFFMAIVQHHVMTICNTMLYIIDKEGV
jgi:hypothetical protein